MKYCDECGAQLEDDAVFCEECGAKQEVSENTAGTLSEASGGGEPSGIPAKPPVSGKKNIAVAASMIGLLLVLVVGGIVIYTRQSGGDKKEAAQETTLLATLSWEEPDADAKMIGAVKLTNYRGKSSIKSSIENLYKIKKTEGAHDNEKNYIHYRFTDKSDSYDAVISRDEDANVVMEELFKNSKKMNDKQLKKFCEKTFKAEDAKGDKESDGKETAKETQESTPTPEPTPTPEATSTPEPTATPEPTPTPAPQNDYAAQYAYLVNTKWSTEGDDTCLITIKSITGDQVLLSLEYCETVGDYEGSRIGSWGDVYGHIENGRITFDLNTLHLSYDDTAKAHGYGPEQDSNGAGSGYIDIPQRNDETMSFNFGWVEAGSEIRLSSGYDAVAWKN